MKHIISILSIALGGSLLLSCNENDRFEVEQYKKIVYALSYTDYAFPAVHKMDGTVSVGYVSAGLSGTVPADKDIVVTFEKDDKALGIYNLINFDLDSAKYANELPISRYKIADNKAVIKAGKQMGLMPVEINLDGLSPDSTYIIPLKITSVSDFDFDKGKSTVLYKIMLENEYASQDEQTSYFMKGRQYLPNGNYIMIAAGKRVFPLSKNEVRTTVHTKPFAKNETVIHKNSMIIKVNEDNSLDLRAFDSKYLEVQQLGGSSENYYGVDKSGVSKDLKFFLNYQYRTRSYDLETNTPGEWSDWTHIMENLKRQ